jgi:hypothetical protein
MSVVGSGTYISRTGASAATIYSGRTLDVGIVFNPTYTLLSGSVYTWVPVGSYVSTSWNPYNVEPTGDYCAITYRRNSDGSETELAYVCVNVHS